MGRGHEPDPALRRIGLARALSKRGVCSRSAATRLILAGKVLLDGRQVRDPEHPTIASSHITLEGQESVAGERLYVMLNKPRGLITTAADEHHRRTVYDCFRDSGLPWLGPVGRLDKASEGLLLFSNDPEWSARLLDPLHHVPRTYHVQVSGPVPEALPGILMRGVRTREGEVLSVREARVLRQGGRNLWLHCVLDEGRNRHLRRMFENLGLPVLRLVRVAIGEVMLGELPKGAWRKLTAEEFAGLDADFAQRTRRIPGLT